MVRPDPALARALALARRQRGAITRVQARKAGLDDYRLHQLVRNEQWQNPLQGGYVVPTGDPFLGRCQVALLVLPSATICGLTAARLHGLPGLPPPTPDEPVYLLLPLGSSRRRKKGVVLRYGPDSAEQRQTVLGLRATDVRETLVDLLVSGSRDSAVCLLDAVVNRGIVDSGMLDDLRRTAGSQPGGDRLADVWPLVGGRADGARRPTTSEPYGR